MATEAGKRAARKAVLGMMAKFGWNPAKLAESAGIDYGTAGDFLNGKRWPKVGTLGKIDVALSWTPGTLAAIGEELQDDPSETVGADPDDESTLLFRRPDGLTGQQWEQMQERMRRGWEWELSQADHQR